uniref:tRNA pseudouridine synthase B n=1 Tax=Eiseniibacteriota bacterium TaxID=2212470 RepID=A0A832I2V7_UNCEI
MTDAPPGARGAAARGPAAPGGARDGLLAVDKPPGPTSHDVVERVRARLGVRGAGHLGTLDPPASGLLLVALGAATRCVSALQGGEKTYEATLRLGVVTDTQDLAGAVLETRPVTCGEAELRAAAAAMTGDLEQVPPMVSALRVGGERLHAIARRGGTVERAPRRVHVAAWEWLAIDPPRATFRVRVSGGTYVRTLAHDLGARLGCGAALERLRRLRSEPFGLERSVTLQELETLPPDEVWARGGLGLDEALAGLPALTLDAGEAESAGHGRWLALEAERVPPRAVGAGPRGLVLRGPLGLVGLAEATRDPEAPARVRVAPRVVFRWAVREGGR